MARNDTTTSEATSQPRNDAYTGMLVVSLVALLTGGVLLYLDYSQYPDKNPPKVSKVAPEGPMPVPVEAPVPKEAAAPPKDAAKK